MNLDRIAERARAADRVIARIDAREQSCAGGFKSLPKGVEAPAKSSAEYPAQHTTPQLNAGTTIEDLIAATERAEMKSRKENL